jgi:hypothetical protein
VTLVFTKELGIMDTLFVLFLSGTHLISPGIIFSPTEFRNAELDRPNDNLLKRFFRDVLPANISAADYSTTTPASLRCSPAGKPV